MPLVIVVVLVVIVISAIYGMIQARKRLEGLFELAQRLGLNFSAAEDYALADRYNFLKQLAQGENRYARNVLSGNYQQYQVLAFDYHYETHSTDSKGRRQTEHHWFSFFILTLSAVFPDLTIRRENFLMKIAEALALRADTQKRLEQLKQRLVKNARIQEGDRPEEDPVELQSEFERLAQELTLLIQRINRTNAVAAPSSVHFFRMRR